MTREIFFYKIRPYLLVGLGLLVLGAGGYLVNELLIYLDASYQQKTEECRLAGNLLNPGDKVRLKSLGTYSSIGVVLSGGCVDNTYTVQVMGVSTMTYRFEDLELVEAASQASTD